MILVAESQNFGLNGGAVSGKQGGARGVAAMEGVGEGLASTLVLLPPP